MIIRAGLTTTTAPRAAVWLSANQTVTVNEALTWESTSKGESCGLDEETITVFTAESGFHTLLCIWAKLSLKNNLLA